MQLLNDDGTPFAISSDAVLASDVCDPLGNLVVALPLTLDTETVGMIYTQVSDTSAWPTGQLRCDLVVTQDGLTVISDTFPIYVDQPITAVT